VNWGRAAVRCGEADLSTGARCIAELLGGRCRLCIRAPHETPVPVDWQGPGWNFAARASAQAIRNHSGPGRWLVAVFLPTGERTVNPAFPIIAVDSKADAVQLAIARAQQLAPGAPVKRWSGDIDEQWQCGPVVVAVAEPGH